MYVTELLWCLGEAAMGKTFPMVIKLLKDEVPEKCSRNEFCRRTGINPNSFDRYIAGISEPTTASLEKIADYFGVSVWELRGEIKPASGQDIDKIRVVYASYSLMKASLEYNQELPPWLFGSVREFAKMIVETTNLNDVFLNSKLKEIKKVAKMVLKKYPTTPKDVQEQFNVFRQELTGSNG